MFTKHIHKTWLSRRYSKLPNSASTSTSTWLMVEMALLLTSPTTHPTEKVTKSIISQLLLSQFWPNFKGRFLVLSWADSNCQGNIFQATVAWQQLSISGISYLLLIRSNQTILWTRICLNYTHCTKLVSKLIMKKKLIMNHQKRGKPNWTLTCAWHNFSHSLFLSLLSIMNNSTAALHIPHNPFPHLEQMLRSF